MIDPVITDSGFVLDLAELDSGSPSIRMIFASDWIERAAPLIEEHWQEIALNKALMVLAPDVATYRALEEQKKLVSLGAFVGEELVGYSVSVLQHHLHYSGLCVAMNDVLFVGKAHRHGSAGVRLIKWTERAARSRGARMMLWHAKPGTALESLMPRLGYQVQDIVFSKEV